MAIWDRKYTDTRTYFNTETALIKKQNSELTIRILGIPVLKRQMDFDADSIESKGQLGFNNK